MEHARVVIVGTGFGGLGMAIRLRQEGFEDFVVLERADEVGGTWRDNHYPGLACDVPSHLYSFSFAPNPDWTSTHSSQEEILRYLRDCADRFGVRPHIRFSCELTGADWSEESRRWELQTSEGPLRCDLLVLATGGFSTPVIPELAGLERFSGAMFHSAAWNDGHDVAGERVAVIGTGASSIQIVPAIQPKVERVKLFQRTPAWVTPRAERRITNVERWLFRRLPLTQRLARLTIYCMHEYAAFGYRHPRWNVLRLIPRVTLMLSVRNRELRRKLRPSYRMGCKRLLQSNDFYRALTKPNAELVTDRIAEVGERSIVTADGSEHEVDTIIFGTGFNNHFAPINYIVRGRDGTSLAEAWREVRTALRGTTVAGFPNMFMLNGPNTGVGTTSFIFQLEAQTAYVLDCLRVMEERDVAAVDPLPAAQEEFNRWIRRKLRGTVWASGCVSHYLDPNGNNTVIWPTYTFLFRHKLRRFDPAEYRLELAREPVAREELTASVR